MYTVRKKKSQKIKNFISKHAHHRHGERNTTARDSSVSTASSTTPTFTPTYATSAPTTSNASIIHNDYAVSYDSYDGSVYHNNISNNNTSSNNTRNSTSSNTDINFNSSFSADYERYMRTRKMNMQRIHELESAKNFNDITRANGISPLEKEILDLADSGGMNSLVYSQSAPASTFPYFVPPPMPTHNSTPSFLYEYASPEVHFPLTQQQKYLTAPPVLMTAPSRPTSHPLSPLTELEKFRSSFTASSPFNITSPPTTYIPRQPTTSYPSYFEQLHETAPSTMLTATEKPPQLANWPNYSVALSPALEKDFMWKESPHAPVAPSNSAPPPSAEVSRASEFTPVRTPDLVVTPSADSFVTATTTTTTSRTPPSGLASIPEHSALPSDPSRDGTLELQQDLENLLVNIQEHYKRRPSALPKAPPPSPNDYGPLQQRILEESAVFADFDFTQPDPTPSQFLSPMSNNLRRSDQLSPYSISPTSSRSQSPASFSQSSHTSQSTTPSRSSSSSPVQFYISPATSDSESYQTPTTTTTTTSTYADGPCTTIPTHIPSPLLSSLPTPAPISSPALASISNAPNHPLPPALVAPPQNAVDCQGNLPSPPPPPVFDQMALSQLRSPRIPPPDFDYSAYDFQGNLLAPPHFPAAANQNEQEEEEEEPVAMHNTTVSTTARHDPNLTSSTTTVSSITATPTSEISTISTATRATTTAIPMSPTSERHDVATSIATLKTTTHVIDTDAGVVADATVTTTSISEGGASPVMTSTSCYEERVMSPEELSGTRSKLLEEIRVGKALRKTPKALPALQHAPSVATGMTPADAKAALASALASRRSQISDESENDDESDDDEAANW